MSNGSNLAFFNQDAQLVKSLRQGNAKAQRQIYDRYASTMLSICIRYVGDRMLAEDVMIEGLMKVFSKIDQYSGEGSLEGWIRRIIVNEALGYLRKQKRSMEESLHLHADSYPDVQTTDAGLDAEALLVMVQELPVGYRTVFNLYAIEGYSHKEIGEMLDITESTSKSQLHRARTLLQKRLTEIDQDIYKNRIMKKRPIDDIFREKLRNHPTEPSAEAWQKLSGKDGGSKTKGIAFYWYVAAGLLIGTLLLYQNEPHDKAGVEEQAVSEVKVPVIEETKPVMPSTLSSVPTKSKEYGPRKRVNTISPTAVTPPQFLAASVPSAHQKAVSAKASGESNAKEEKPLPSLLERTTVPIIGAEDELTIASVPARVEEKESRVILVKVEEPEVFVNEKSGKFSRLFQQLKNVKSGDPVDWDQVGINPKALMARVDERLGGNDGTHSGRMRKSKVPEPNE